MMTAIAELFFDHPKAAGSQITRHLEKNPSALGLLNRGVSNLPQQIGLAMANLFDDPLAGVVLYGWVKQRAIRAACVQTTGIPGATESVVVADHTVEVEHRPRVFLDVAGQRIALLELVLAVSLHLESVTVTVIEGRLTAVGPGDASSTAELGVAMPGGHIYPLVRREVARVSLKPQHLVAAV
jgi:hypothetical protein